MRMILLGMVWSFSMSPVEAETHDSVLCIIWLSNSPVVENWICGSQAGCQ